MVLLMCGFFEYCVTINVGVNIFFGEFLNVKGFWFYLYTDKPMESKFRGKAAGWFDFFLLLFLWDRAPIL